MSSETPSHERARAWDAVLWHIEGLETESARAEAVEDVKCLIAAERADAERVQRERADANAAKCLRYREQIEELENAFGRQRERADGMERVAKALRAETIQAMADATRPYRMAIARWWVEGGHNWSSRSGERLRSMLTDADIDAARKEDGRE